MEDVRFPLLSETIERLANELNIALGVPVKPPRTVVEVWAQAGRIPTLLQQLNEEFNFGMMPTQEFEQSRTYQEFLQTRYYAFLMLNRDTDGPIAWFERHIRNVMLKSNQLIPCLFDTVIWGLHWRYNRRDCVICGCHRPDIVDPWIPLRICHRIPLFIQGEYHKYYVVDNTLDTFLPLIPEELLFQSDDKFQEWRQHAEDVITK